MWSDDCACRRCGRGNWLEIRVPEGLFDAAKVPGTLLLPAVEIVPVPSCPPPESAWRIVPLREWNCACPKSAVPVTNRSMCLSQVAPCLESAWHIVPGRGWNCACPKLPRASKVPGTSFLAAVGIVPVPSRPNPLANRSTQLPDVPVTNRSTEPPDVPVTNRSMCLS